MDIKMKLTEYLTQVESRVVQATPGAWWAQMPEDNFDTAYVYTDPGALLAITTHYGRMREDAQLIAHAPTDLTKLCKALRIAVEALEKIKDYETQTIYGYSGDEQLAIDDAWSRTADVAKDALTALDQLCQGVSGESDSENTLR